MMKILTVINNRGLDTVLAVIEMDEETFKKLQIFDIDTYNAFKKETGMDPWDYVIGNDMTKITNIDDYISIWV